MKILRILYLLLLLPQFGCIGPGVGSHYRRDVEPFLEKVNESYQPQVVDGVMEPKQFPDLEKDQETLLGIDSNGDGVRDDLEIYINRRYKFDYEREVYKKFYRHVQKFILTADSMTKDQLKGELNQFYADEDCFFYLHSNLKLPRTTDDFHSSFEYSFNTQDRLDKFNLTTSALSPGDSYGSKNGTFAERFSECPESVKKKYPYK